MMQSNAPFFSIVIPTYNRASFILKTIDSITKGTFQDFEILVIDDGSTDNTEEVVAPLINDKLKYFKKSNEERGAARNYGTNRANGKYINFFDSDDLAYPNHLEEADKFIKENSCPEVFHLGYELRDEQQLLIKRSLLPKKLNRVLIGGNHLSTNGVFIKKNIALLHPFSEDIDLSVSEDYQLWLRLASRYDFLNSNTITSRVINHNSRSVFNTDRDKLLLRIKILKQTLMNDKEFLKAYNSNINEFKACLDLYIALHFTMAKMPISEVLSYTKSALSKKPNMIFDRRILGILKVLINNQFN